MAPRVLGAPSPAGQFRHPRGLALTPDDAFLLVADVGNRRVVLRATDDGAWVRQLTGPLGTLRSPYGSRDRLGDGIQQSSSQ
jgi:hypothetical protein